MIKFYLKAQKNDVEISFLRAFFMSLRSTATARFLDNFLIWRNYQPDLTLDEMEAFYLAGVNVEKVSEALKVCKDKNIEIKINELTAIDLSGNDLKKSIDAAKSYENFYFNFEEQESKIQISIRTEFQKKPGILIFDNNQIESKIEQKVKSFIIENKEMKSSLIERILNKEIIGSDFWKNEFNSKLLNQEIRINNWH